MAQSKVESTRYVCDAPTCDASEVVAMDAEPKGFTGTVNAPGYAARDLADLDWYACRETHMGPAARQVVSDNAPVTVEPQRPDEFNGGYQDRVAAGMSKDEWDKHAAGRLSEDECEAEEDVARELYSQGQGA